MTDLIPVKTLGIKNLMPGLAERGKIKIGEKGATRTSGNGNDFQPPQKLDHFKITTTARDSTGNYQQDKRLHQLLGDEPTELPVMLMYDDIGLNFQTRYACYNGRSLWCSGDGETAIRQLKPANKNTKEPAEFGPVSCTCHRQAPTYDGPDKCKMNGTLSVIITGAEVVGGVWKFRTTSYNTIVGLLSAMALIKRISGGALAGLPLWLTLSPKSVMDPIHNKQQTVYVVGLEYRGSPAALMQAGYHTLLLRKEHDMRVYDIEAEARQLITNEPNSYAAPDDIDDELNEFYPAKTADDPEAEPERIIARTGTTGERLADAVKDMAEPKAQTAPVIDKPTKPEPVAKAPRAKPAAKPAAKPEAKAAPAADPADDFTPVNLF